MALTGSQPAYRLAQGGVMRGGTSRGNVHSPQVFVAIDGIQYATARAVDGEKVLDDTLVISERDGATPNTCSFTVQGFQPTDGQDVVITLGSINNLQRLFAGTVLIDTTGYVGTPANGHDVVNVIDYTWQLTRDTISQRWTNESGTVIARAILAVAAPRGFTSALVAEGLPVLSEFTVTDQTLASALSALAARLGASWKPTYDKDCRFGLTTDPLTTTDPTPLTSAHATLTALRVRRDLGPVITRQPVEGGGSTALASCGVGETILPVAVTSWYAPPGLVACGPQRIAYTGLTQSRPSLAPSLALVGAAAGLAFDLYYGYAYTDVTAAGESLESPRATVIFGTPATPTDTPIVSPYAPGNLTQPADYQWRVTYSPTAPPGGTAPALPETAVGPVSAVLRTGPGALGAVVVLAAPPAWVRTVNVYRTLGGGSTYAFEFSTGTPVNGGGYSTGLSDAVLVTRAAAPSSASFLAPTAAVSAVAIGPAATTARKVYRTAGQATLAAAETAQLKLQQTIADNTATDGVTDATVDGSLGANVPTVDTSDLNSLAVTTTSGSTASGATTVNVTTAAAFATTGGWAICGSLTIRFTGKTATSLTGIPATGYGSIGAAIPSGTLITGTLALTGIPASGVGSIRYPIHQGDPVNLRVVLDDLPAQATIAALLGGSDDGIIEGPLIQDGRLSETEARARGTARLAQKSAIAVSLSYACRDLNTHAAATIAVNLAAPTSVVASFKLQQVTIDTFHPALWPTFHAEASSDRFTLEDFLRRARPTPP
jgi:hypothetical protein